MDRINLDSMKDTPRSWALAPRVFVGTSGWMYDWNPEGSFRWYARESGLNAVELNASFYRFPFKKQAESWARVSLEYGIRWAVKVHRSITHYRRLKEPALQVWEKFRAIFKPLEDTGLLDFYLFQLPPSFARTPENVRRIEGFLEGSRLEPSKFAVEFRHTSWFMGETIDTARSLGITLVSIDSPMATWIVSSNGLVYLRMHGRSDWYAHDYTEQELRETAEAIARLNPKAVYVFFNNNHWMLKNARLFLSMLKTVLI